MTETRSSAISPLNKGLGPLDSPQTAADIAQLAWNLLREDLNLPVAVLYNDRLTHNLQWMQRFIAEYGVKLAPHGKTTMAPALFQRQLDAGAWGITLATAPQVRVAYEHGVRRILMANQLVGKANMEIIADLLHDPGFEFFCLVDSPEQVDQLGKYFANLESRVNVLLELGVNGGRTGIRDNMQLEAVLAALARQRDSVALCGVELYEGVLSDEESIRAFLQRAVAVAQTLVGASLVQRSPILLSGAGSAWYDVVADVFSQVGFGDTVEIVLRPGCYLTHDAGLYREAQEKILERNPIARRMQSSLVPALQVWAYVQSLPEENLAIIGMGKRDAAFDAGLPMPSLRFRPGTEAPNAAPAHWSITRMMDQHAYMRIAPDDDLHIGDMVAFDISHPCLTFDKWRTLAVVDANYHVIDIIETFF